jgi:hypothetical protein
MRTPLPALFRWTLAAACLAGASPLPAQELTQSLTVAEVECTELQLERLLRRMDALVPGAPFVPVNDLLVAPGDGEPSYQGLQATVQAEDGSGPEWQLAFHLQPVRSLLTNPARPPLGQVSLTREEPSSSLVPPGGAPQISVVLDPGLAQPAPPGVELAIDNVAGPAGRSTSTRPGRGLSQDGLLTPCTDRLTAFDRHVFAVLQRIVRVQTRFALGSIVQAPSEIALFRGADPHVYRLNAYGGASGRVAVEIVVGWTPEGRLTTAEMRILPNCPALDGRPGCTDRFAVRLVETRIRLVPPVFGGVESWHPEAPGAAQVVHSTPVGTFITEDTADLAALLAGTSWNGG